MSSIASRGRIARLLPVAAGIALVLAGCNNNNPESSNAPDSGSGNVAMPTIAVIPKGTTHVFWQSVKAGAEKAGMESGVKVQWQGPQKENDPGAQVRIVEDIITTRPAGIVLAPIDKSALVGVIDRAKAAGIPVSIIDSKADTENYVSFVATDNLKGGEIAAMRVGKLLGGKGKVAIIPVMPNSASTGDREAGFEKAMKAKFPGITVVRSNYGMSDRNQSLTVSEDLLTREKNVDAIFGPNESSTVGALQALKNRNLVGKVKLVGFDATKQLEASLVKGEIDSLVLQNPYKMGYEGVKSLVDQRAGKKPEKRIDTGVALMTKENMDTPELRALRSGS